jgi:subtilisin-like proprotein convertase family protein
MIGPQFDFEAATRTLISVPSRRAVLRGLAAAGLSLGALRLEDAVEAKNKKRKGKKRKHKKQKQHQNQDQNQNPIPPVDTPSPPPPVETPPPPPPPPARGLVTRTFTSAAPITIPNGAPSVTRGKANPYPSTIAVSGFVNGTITDVNLIINDLTHEALLDLDILLSTSDGRQALVLSDVNSRSAVADIDLTLDDEAGAALPKYEGQEVDLPSGTFRPTDHTYYADTFAAPAPAPNGNIALSTFDGTNPNGTWQLWVMDNATGDVGDVGGWALQITAEVDLV